MIKSAYYEVVVAPGRALNYASGFTSGPVWSNIYSQLEYPIWLHVWQHTIDSVLIIKSLYER